MAILDSGDRTQFDTGAVRDMRVGKGRCDLMPLDVAFYATGRVAEPLKLLSYFTESGEWTDLVDVLQSFCDERYDADLQTMLLEVSIHFEEGANKYGENNWQKGIPVNCYIDSAARHYLKCWRGDDDEPHDRAFVWNIMCAMWTCLHKPDLNNYAKESIAHGA